MYHTILVPLDGSKRAERILSHVEELAHCNHSRVVSLLANTQTLFFKFAKYPNAF